MNSVYVHIPFCRSRCAYCDFYSTVNDEQLQRLYVEALIKEINVYKRLRDEGRLALFSEIETLYVGGGTPSALYRGAIKKIVSALSECFKLNLTEFTVECNPESFDVEKAYELAEAGATRVSLGVQSLNDKTLSAIGRAHDAGQAKAAVKLAAQRFSASADIILGLPYQTERDISQCVDFFGETGIEHFSAYELTLSKNTTLYRAADRGEITLPDDDGLADLYDYAVKKAQEAGFERYEVSSFCKNGKISAHNFGYWTGSEYLGIGASASGCFSGRRYKNVCDIDKYLKTVKMSPPVFEEEILSDEERLYERIILGLRTARGVDIRRAEADFGINFAAKYAENLEKIKDFTVNNDDFLRVKPRYFNVLNQILIHF